MKKSPAVVILSIIFYLWACYAGRLTPYVRNLVSIGAVVVTAVLLLIQWKFIGLNLGLTLFFTAVYMLAEKFPKRPKLHRLRREQVTFLQDMFFWISLIMVVFAIEEF